jgi:hypothetical protein
MIDDNLQFDWQATTPLEVDYPAGLSDLDSNNPL